MVLPNVAVSANESLERDIAELLTRPVGRLCMTRIQITMSN